MHVLNGTVSVAMIPWHVGEDLFHRELNSLINLPRSNGWELRSTSVGQNRLNALIVLSVTAGGLSLAAGIAVIAWFLRIRRTFRHNLIIILILSDMLKTLWLVILPTIELIKGSASGSNSAICQASGFFLSVGIEACDLAVLLIAIHTALHIFQGESGLYPYRRAAYCFVAGVPLMLAALAFINAPAFTTFGPYCYLPLDPSWPSLALSWIPRYIVFITILISYTFIYFYVRFLMDKFGDDHAIRRPRMSKSEKGQAQQRATVPSPPPKANHGYSPTRSQGEAILRSQGSGGSGSNSNGTAKKSSETIFRNASSNYSDAVGRLPPTITLSAPSLSLGDLENELPKIIHANAQTPLEHHSCGYVDSGSPQPAARQLQPSISSPGREQRQHMQLALTTNLDLQQQLQSGTQGPAGMPCQTTASPCIIISPSTLHETGMPKTRDKIRRQLGQLFIYPIVYLLGWLLPFVAHVLKTDKTDEPFGLIVASLASLCIQGLVDSLVFLLMEKPWRHGQGDTDATVCPLRWCLTFGRAVAGRTNQEMMADGRIARQRRATEVEESRLPDSDAEKLPRDWWETTLADIDQFGPIEGVMAPDEAAWMQKKDMN